MNVSNVDSGIEMAREELSKLIQEFFVNDLDNDNDRHAVVDRMLRGRRVKIILDTFPELSRESDEEGVLPLHRAVEAGAPFQVLEKFVSCFPESLVEQDNYGDTPLNVACGSLFDNFELKVYNLLITPDAVCLRNHEQCLPLHEYCRALHRNLEVVQHLVNTYPEGVSKLTNFHETPLHLVAWEARQADMPILEYLADLYPEALLGRNDEGRTPLHCACVSSQSVEVVQLLLGLCTEATSMVDSNGCTPLHVLVERCRDMDLMEPIARLLVESNPQCLETRDAAQRTPLHSFCARVVWRVGVIPFLAEAYPKALLLRDSQNETPLHTVCRKFTANDTNVVDYLVQKCPLVLQPQGGRGMSTPLHETCKSETLSMILLKMLSISEEAVAARDENGRTSLHWLSHAGNINQGSLDTLLGKCPELPRMRDDQGRIPLLCALEGFKSASSRETRQSRETVNLLLKAFPRGVFMADNDGMTPLEYACERDLDLSLIYQLVKVNPIAVLRQERVIVGSNE